MATTKLPLRQIDSVPVDACDTFVADGVYNRFFLGHKPILDSVLVIINGVVQECDTDFSVDILSEHPSVTLIETPAKYDHVEIRYRRTEKPVRADKVGSYGYGAQQTYIVDSTGQIQVAGSGFGSSFTYYATTLGTSFSAINPGPGDNYIYFIESTGKVRGYGANNFGGLGNLGGATSPYIARPGSYSMVRGRYEGGAAIDAATGQIYCWGSNGNGTVGDNTITTRSSPVAIVRPGSYIDMAFNYDLNNGQYYGTAIDSDGNAWGWGAGGLFNIIGDNAGVKRSSPVSIIRNNAVLGPFVKVAGGYLCKYLLDSARHLWSWGLDNYNQNKGSLGYGENTTGRNYPAAVMHDKQFLEISAGYGHALSVDSSGYLWSWGLNDYGQLGQGDTTNRSAPTSINLNVSFTHVYAASSWSAAVDHTGVLWSWGYNNAGQLGNGNTVNQSYPVSVKKL